MKRKITLKIFLKNIIDPFEITANKDFLLDYGIGKEKWGDKDLTLQYAFKVYDNDMFPYFKEYLLNLSNYLTDTSQIEKIEFEIIDLDNKDNNICYSFQNNEFFNLHMNYVIDFLPRFMMAFNVVP